MKRQFLKHINAKSHAHTWNTRFVNLGHGINIFKSLKILDRWATTGADRVSTDSIALIVFKQKSYH